MAAVDKLDLTPLQQAISHLEARLLQTNAMAEEHARFLTTLGVLFGVASVIAMLAVGEGASAEAQDQIRRLGSRNVILRSVKPPQVGDEDAETRVLSYGLTRDDFERISETFPGVEQSVPMLQTPAEVRSGPIRGADGTTMRVARVDPLKGHGVEGDECRNVAEQYPLVGFGRAAARRSRPRWS